MCDPKDKTDITFPDEEPTKPEANRTLDEIGAEWLVDLSVPSSERPTRPLGVLIVKKK